MKTFNQTKESKLVSNSKLVNRANTRLVTMTLAKTAASHKVECVQWNPALYTPLKSAIYDIADSRFYKLEMKAT